MHLFRSFTYRATGLAAGITISYAATNNSTSPRDTLFPGPAPDTPNYDLPLDPELKEEGMYSHVGT